MKFLEIFIKIFMNKGFLIQYAYMIKFKYVIL